MKPFRLWVYRRLTWWLPETRFFAWKRFLLGWAGATIGTDVRINSSALFSGNGDLCIGDDVWVGAGCRIYSTAGAKVTIGSHCDFGPEVMIITGSHEIDPVCSHIAGKGTAASVTIMDGAWLGARATILPGVILAEKTVVAAGSVVIRPNFECTTLVAGAPAVPKKRYQ